MVNTFFIKPNIYETAKMLDYKRLGKQRVEAKQIIDILEQIDSGMVVTKNSWVNHPIVKSWIGFTNHLKVYCNIMIKEWVSRGYNNTMQLYNIDESLYNIKQYGDTNYDQYSFPFWVSFPPFYLSHQAALCRKDPKYYKSLITDELIPFLNNGYLWPCNINFNCYSNWNFNFHDKLGEGCPSVYKINIIEVLKWCVNPLVNPLTLRSITQKSQIYKNYESAMIAHSIFVSDRIVYFSNIQIGNLQYSIHYFEQYYINIGGVPNPSDLVIKFSN